MSTPPKLTIWAWPAFTFFSTYEKQQVGVKRARKGVEEKDEGKGNTDGTPLDFIVFVVESYSL